MRYLAGLPLILSAGIGAIGAGLAQPPMPAIKAAPQLFGESCAACHGRDLKGGTAGSVFTARVLAQTDAILSRSIAIGPSGMADHAFKSKLGLSDDQVFRLVAFMRNQGGNLAPRPAFIPNPNGRIITTQKATFKVETIADNLETPWGMAFLPDGRILVTERPGRLRIVSKDGTLSDPVVGTPKVWERQDSGLLDVAVPPDYRKNGWIYLAYTDLRPGYTPSATELGQAPAGAAGTPAARPPSPPSMTVLIRGRLSPAGEWTDTHEIFRAPSDLYTASGAHYGTRFLFDGRKHIFYSLGERGDQTNAQNLATPLGKIHRINDDGSVPVDNPFYNTPGAVKTIWSYGHRNPEGLAIDPATGELWESEHGPTGGDEINLIRKGHNYGWGVVSWGLQPNINETSHAGMDLPVVYYTPTMAPSGISFYGGTRFPGWKGDLFVSMLAGQQLRRLVVKGNKVTEQEAIFADFGRTRAVATGPDGDIYVLVQNPTGTGTGLSLSASTPGRLLRLVPVRKPT